MCVVLVFAAMLEFAIVNTLARKEIRQMSLNARNSARAENGSIPADVVCPPKHPFRHRPVGL